jgi:signal transduction histidine kinase
VAPARQRTLGRQGRFAAYVAHELSTPITLQRALVELALADPHADTATLRAMGERVLQSCEHQQRLIEALLDLTLSQRGLRRHEPVDIAAATRKALGGHDLREFDCIVALDPAWTTGDPDLVQRLANNLVSNATRHNIAGGRIEVRTSTDAQHAVLAIANTGQAIPDLELTRIFRPFERIGSQARAGTDGVGLGLAIVQAVADAHNASIAARARASGGLQIVVRFPANATRSRPLALRRLATAPLAEPDQRLGA